MTQVLEAPRITEPQSAGRRSAADIFPPTLEPGRLEPPTHPAVPRLRTGRLHCAPAPTDAAAPVRRPRRMDWTERAFEAGWIALLLACAAEGVCRLLWAVQP